MPNKHKTWADWYDHWFSVREIAQSKVLQWAFGAHLLATFLAFYDWIGKAESTAPLAEYGFYQCWPYFQNCHEYFFLADIPFGISQPLLYMGFFGLMAYIVWCMTEQRWRQAHLAALLILVWKFLNILVLNMSHMANFEYYHLMFGIVLLLLPHKLFFLKFSVVWFYFLSTATKIHEGWVLGTYFTTLNTGLPIFGHSTAPVWTNLVILMEMLAAWLLIGPKHWWQRGVFIFFVIFHLYSGLLVNYRYPATVLPMVLILFGPWYSYTKAPKGWSTLAGWSLMGLLLLGQVWSHFIPGNAKLTLEGNYYGLYMFEANHQCRSTTTMHYADGSTGTPIELKSAAAHVRCNPYQYWTQFKATQCRPEVSHVAWQFDHSINGGPFYRIVDVIDACNLTYRPFGKNPWIKTETTAPIVGKAYRNTYD